MTRFEADDTVEIMTSAIGVLNKFERFRRALAGDPVDRPPVWLMRQAGRYLPQYHLVRNRYDFLTLCRTPDAAAEVSLQPLAVLDVDAVIVFNDILVPLEAMGVPVTFGEHGPVLAQAVRDTATAERLRPAFFDGGEPVAQTLRLLRSMLGVETALLGFAGAPFTLAAYAVEGVLSRNLDVIKSLRYQQPALLHCVLERIAETVADYLRIQIEAGVDMVQLFDTWAGALSLADYEEYALPYQRAVIARVRPLGIPVALYVNGSAAVLEAMAASGADVLSVDWRLPLDTVRCRVGPDVVLQGNLDPAALYGSAETVTALVKGMVAAVRGDTRYIANLGHGILPGTPVESVKAFVRAVKGEAP